MNGLEWYYGIAGGEGGVVATPKCAEATRYGGDLGSYVRHHLCEGTCLAVQPKHGGIFTAVKLLLPRKPNPWEKKTHRPVATNTRHRGTGPLISAHMAHPAPT